MTGRKVCAYLERGLECRNARADGSQSCGCNPEAMPPAAVSTIGDIFPDFTPRPMTCADCAGSFIAHAGTVCGQREPSGAWLVFCGCQDRDTMSPDAWSGHAGAGLSPITDAERAEEISQDQDSEPGDSWGESFRERPEYFEAASPEDMADDLAEAGEALALACDAAAERGADDMTHDGDPTASGEALGLEGRALAAYVDAWLDAKLEGHCDGLASLRAECPVCGAGCTGSCEFDAERGL